MSEPPRDPPRLLPACVPDARTTTREGPRAPSASFDAQVIGQGGARRGLKGGAPVIDQAQHAYLETEWSGPSNRRTPTGAKRRERV